MPYLVIKIVYRTTFYEFSALASAESSGRHWPALEALGNFSNAGEIKTENTGFADESVHTYYTIPLSCIIMTSKWYCALVDSLVEELMYKNLEMYQPPTQEHIIVSWLGLP